MPCQRHANSHHDGASDVTKNCVTWRSFVDVKFLAWCMKSSEVNNTSLYERTINDMKRIHQYIVNLKAVENDDDIEQ
jgi:hypothetical protein